MTAQDAKGRFWKFLTSIPVVLGAIAALGTATFFLLDFAIEAKATMKRWDDGFESVERMAEKIEKQTARIDALERQIAALDERYEAVQKRPIRFAHVGSEVTDTLPGGLAVVTWLILVDRTDCPPPLIALNMVDAEDIVRPVTVGDFRPVKLEAGPVPTAISYEVIAPDKAAPGLGRLWAEATYKCPNGFEVTIPSPKIRWRILSDEDDD